VGNAYNPSIQEAKAGGFPGLTGRSCFINNKAKTQKNPEQQQQKLKSMSQTL
jgi:hypothetical protein